MISKSAREQPCLGRRSGWVTVLGVAGLVLKQAGILSSYWLVA